MCDPCVSRRNLVTSPSIAVADNGRLWATWFSCPDRGESTNTYVIVATSSDDGRTWREHMMVDPDGLGPRRAFDPQVWVTPDGRLAWTWTDRTGGKGCEVTDGLWLAFFDDATKPFPSMTKPRCVAHGIMNNVPTVLSDGTWVFPVCVWYSAKSAGMVVSQDAGKTWTFRGGATIKNFQDRNFDEHPIVEMKNGDLWALSRCNSGIRRAISSDKGFTWTSSEPFPEGKVRHTPSRFVFMRLKSGRLLFIKHGPIDKNVNRKQMTAYLSEDEGETWKGGLMVDEREWAAYPIACQRKDGLIYCTYDFDRLGRQDILFATFTEEDILAGKDVSGKVRLRQVISTRARECK